MAGELTPLSAPPWADGQPAPGIGGYAGGWNPHGGLGPRVFQTHSRRFSAEGDPMVAVRVTDMIRGGQVVRDPVEVVWDRAEVMDLETARRTGQALLDAAAAVVATAGR